MAARLLQYEMLDRARDAFVGVAGGFKPRHGLHRIDGVAHRHAGAGVLQHGQVVLLVTYGHHVGAVDAQVLGQLLQAWPLAGAMVEHLQEERRALQHREALGQFGRQACDGGIQHVRRVDHHQLDEGHRRVHVLHAAIRQRHPRKMRVGHGVVADVLVGRVHALAVQGLEVHAQVAGHLLAEQEVVEAERILDHGFARADALHQAAVAGDAVVVVTGDAQLVQERCQAGNRAATGQHDVHAQRARLRDGLPGPRGKRVDGVQQGAIHVDGDQFDGRLPAAHVHCVQLVRGTPVYPLMPGSPLCPRWPGYCRTL
ncbi:hypothetical protein G6F35_010572 [Rhizopus arrhizus]|nr:hypothetical protein G6F35_010572 [Rhizopus arrhizus]